MSSGNRMTEFLHKQSFPVEQPMEISDQIPIQDRKLETSKYRVDVSSLVSKFDDEMEQTMNFPYGKVWADEDINEAKRRLREDLIRFIEKYQSRLEEADVLFMR